MDLGVDYDRSEDIKVVTEDQAQSITENLMALLQTGTKDEVQQHGLREQLRVPAVRKFVVDQLAENKLNNPHAIMYLAGAIGSSIQHDQSAAHQLLSLVNDTDVDFHTRQQALYALIQPICYQHRDAIHLVTILSYCLPQSL